MGSFFLPKHKCYDPGQHPDPLVETGPAEKAQRHHRTRPRPALLPHLGHLLKIYFENNRPLNRCYSKHFE